ncbi:MAG: hypothetical protein CMD35_03910 [Flavobacteriales bacterium]|nr:hypothetical protein [Flavobacteriales bacterium]
MEITVLGTGNAFSEDTRFNSAFLIKTNKFNALIDCGFTVPLALQKEGIPFSSIDYILITHYHGDHYAGLASLLLGLKYVSPQYKKLTIIGPGDLEQKVYTLLNVLYPGTERLIQDLNIEFKGVNPSGEELKTKDFNLEIHPMIHSDLALPVGYVLQSNGFKMGFSGDTAWHDGVTSFLTNCSNAILECNFSEKIGEGHISVEELEASEIVQKKKKNIFLTHLHTESSEKAKKLGYNVLSDGDVLNFKS